MRLTTVIWAERRRVFPLLAIAVLVAVLSACRATAAPADRIPIEAPRPANWRALRPPVQAEIPLPPAEKLIAQLSSLRYAARERATRLLGRHDRTAVPLLERAAIDGQAEASIRALHALEDLTVGALTNEDEELAEAALAALDAIWTSDDQQLQGRAAAVILAHRSVIHDFALRKVRQMRGTIHVRPGSTATFTDGKQRAVIARVIITRHWEGGLEGLLYVRFLRPGQVYFIKGSDLPEGIAARFGALPPFITSEERGAAQLGVSRDTRLFGAGRGCRVDEVKPNSAAAEAGIQQNDVIVKFNGKAIKDFHALVNEIAKLEPGQTVPTTVVRPGGKIVELEVTLHGWPAPEDPKTTGQTPNSAGGIPPAR